MLSIHRSIFEQKLKQLKDQVDHLMPFVPTQGSTANAVQDKKKRICDNYETRIVVVKEHSVAGGKLFTFIKENWHSSQTLCIRKFDEIQSSLRHHELFSIQLLKLKYDKQAIGPAKEEVYQQKRKLIPDPPTDIKCFPKHNSLELTWNEPSTTVGIIKIYKVQLLQNSKPNSKCKDFFSEGTECSVEITDLVPNTQYNVRICSLNEQYRSEYSQSIHVKTTAGVPAKPCKPEVCSESTGRIKVSVYRLAKEHQNGSPVNKLIVQCELDSDWETSAVVPIKANDDNKPIITAVNLPSKCNDAEIRNLYYRVSMENEAGMSEYSEIATLPVIELHPYRTDLIVQDVYSRHIVLRLTPPKAYPNSVKYSIRMKEGKSSQWKIIAQKWEQNVYTVENLTPAATYAFQVACCSIKYEGDWSKDYKVTTKADKPTPPKRPEISFNTGKGKCAHVLTIPGISKSQENGSSVKKVIIEHVENDSNSWNSEEISTCMTEKPYRQPLSPIFNSSSRDAVLYYRVRFVNDIGMSDASDVIELHVSELYPNPPENIYVSDVTADQIKLGWSFPTVNPVSVTHFTIQYKKSGGKYKEDKTDRTYYHASALLPGTQYVFEISSCNGKYSGEWCEFHQKTKPGPPDAPEKPLLHELHQDNKVTYYLSFKRLPKEGEHGSPVSKITVESITDASGPPVVIQCHPVEIYDKIIHVPIVPYADSHVNSFDYRAYFTNEVGKSTYSEPLHIPVAELFPMAPENFHAAEVLARSIRLEWNRPTSNPNSVLHYKVMMAKNENCSQWSAVNVKAQFQVYDDLIPARSYKFCVASCNSKFPAGGESCKEIVVRTEADKPCCPSKPDIKIECDSSGKTKYLLVVTMLPEDKENGSPVQKIVVKSKIHGDSKYDTKEFIACRNDPVKSYLIKPPNATKVFTVQYHIRMKNKAGLSDPSDVHELESSQMIPGPPKNLVADKDRILFNSIVLIWEEPDENPKSVEYYMIQKRLKSEVNENDTSFNHELWSNVKKCDDPGVTKASVPELTPNTEYQFMIISFNKDGRKCGQSSNILNITTSPCKPQKPDSSSIILIVNNQFSATLSLPKPPINETGSEIQEMSVQRMDEHMKAEESIPNMKNPYIFKIPKEQDERIIACIPIGRVTHFIRVKLRNSKGYSSYSESVGVAPDDLKPGPPTITNKGSINPTTDSVAIEWEAPNLHKRAANRYMFMLKKHLELDWGPPIEPINHERKGNSHRGILKNLLPSTSYSVRIFAANGNLYGDFSEEISILTKAGKPFAPPLPTINVGQDPAIAYLSIEHKSERDNGASIQLVRIEQFTNGNMWRVIHEQNIRCPKNEFFHAEVPLESVTQSFDANGEYRYRVKFKNKIGESSPSEAVSLPFSALKPGQVNAVQFESEAHRIKVFWRMPQIHPAIVNGFTIEEQVSEHSWRSIQTCEVSAHSSTIKSLSSNKEYIYRIAATSKFDIKGVPVVIHTKTLEIFPTRPLNLRVDRKSNSKFKVRWKEPHCDPDALHYYRIQVFESANSRLIYACTLKRNCRSKVVTNLNPSTTYLIKVTAMNEAKHWKEESFDEITEATLMSTTKRNLASTAMAIPTLGIATAAFLYFTKPDADSTMIDSDDESSFMEEWSLQESSTTDVEGIADAASDETEGDGSASEGQSSDTDDHDEHYVGPNTEVQDLLQ